MELLVSETVPNTWYRFSKHPLEIMRVTTPNQNNDEYYFVDSLGGVVTIEKDKTIIKI